jgi:hypothetical protein
MSEILQTKVPTDKETAFFFFGILAFFAGFNERWTNVLFGKAERTIAGSLGAGIRPPRLEEDEEEEEEEEEGE